MPVGLRVFTRHSARMLDQLAQDRFGLPPIVLMEHAAIHLCAAALDRLGSRIRDGVLICCGKGNNGGDGMAAARLLHNARVPVSLVLCAEAWDHVGEARVHADAALHMGLPMQVASAGDIRGAFDRAWSHLGRPAVILDALTGTGLQTIVEPGAMLAHLVGAINDARAAGECAVIAADLPSGLECDSGRPLIRQPDGSSTAVRADLTVTFAGWKQGFFAPEAQPFLGEVMIAEIGVPTELVEEVGREGPLAQP